MANDTHSAERLKQLHQRIEQWRLTRTQHGPMPGEHWEEATWLARSLGVSPVARALGLGYRERPPAGRPGEPCWRDPRVEASRASMTTAARTRGARIAPEASPR